VHMLPAWYDVDDVDALKRLDAELRGEDTQSRRQLTPRPRFAAHSAKLMRQLAGARDFGRAVARAATTDRIHA
jgi:hypothetical protein